MRLDCRIDTQCERTQNRKSIFAWGPLNAIYPCRNRYGFISHRYNRIAVHAHTHAHWFCAVLCYAVRAERVSSALCVSEPMYNYICAVHRYTVELTRSAEEQQRRAQLLSEFSR